MSGRVARSLLVWFVSGALLTPPPALARPHQEVQMRGDISVCANPNALPYASDRPETPGFQIEIARAIARRLGVQLRVEWIVPRMRAATVDCDMLMDSIARADIQSPAIKLSVPYQTGGVSLAFPPGQPTVASYKDLRPGSRIGVITNSVASMIVGRAGARIVPFAFEDDLLEAVGRGDVEAGALSPASIGYYNLNHAGRRITLVHAEDSEPDLKWVVAVGLRRADAALVDAVNGAVAALLADGTIASIYGKYGVDHQQP